jgi:sugar/nucleoside kinase (ribokinase family)
MKVYDIVFLGHYTKDTIVSASGTRVVDGGAFNYGAHVTIRMGLKVAAVTRLAQKDHRVVDELTRLGVDVFAQITPESTCLRLEYPTSDLDERIIYVTSSAGAFTPAEVEFLKARAVIIGASMRGEVGIDVIQALKDKETLLAADVQGFVRVARHGKLTYEAWPEKRKILACVDVLKTDAIEAKMLTNESDIIVAARMLSEMGPREIVLTHRDGVLVWADGRSYEAGFFPQKLIGRSGRGDTCVAGYVAKRLTSPPEEATIWAAALTSLKMEAEGPFRREIGLVDDLKRRMY